MVLRAKGLGKEARFCHALWPGIEDGNILGLRGNAGTNERRHWRTCRRKSL
jgi:hypothetical protein